MRRKRRRRRTIIWTSEPPASLRLKTRSGSRRCSRLRSCSLTPKLKTMQYCHQMMTALVSQHVCNVPCMHITHPLMELFCNPPHTGSKPVPFICIFFYVVRSLYLQVAAKASSENSTVYFGMQISSAAVRDVFQQTGR